MKGYGVFDRDYVIVSSDVMAKEGDLVLVLLYNEFLSVKQYFVDGDSVLLKADDDILIDAGLVNVVGVVTGVFRCK